MKKWFLSVFLCLFLFLPLFGSFGAQIEASETASVSALAVAQETGVQDLTVPKNRVDRMVSLLSTQAVEEDSPLNFLKVAIRKAIASGVSVNTVVLLFLFPLVASLVAFSRQVVGLSGFGMITPSLLAMAFLSTGGLVGILMLTFVVGVAMLGRVLMKKIRLPYLPKLAVLLWVVSMSVLALIIGSSYTGLQSFLAIGIFPIILFMSVAETFIEAQITRNFSTSLTMLLETVVVAFVSYKLMSAHFVQSIALLNPEMMMIFVLILNMLIGRYKGLRLLEMWRFRKIILR